MALATITTAMTDLAPIRRGAARNCATRVVVNGAGPAGSLVALLLARREIPATLIEQHRFPREKVCGECVSALGWQILERVGLAGRVKEAGAVEMRRGIIHAA